MFMCLLCRLLDWWNSTSPGEQRTVSQGTNSSINTPRNIVCRSTEYITRWISSGVKRIYEQSTQHPFIAFLVHLSLPYGHFSSMLCSSFRGGHVDMAGDHPLTSLVWQERLDCYWLVLSRSERKASARGLGRWGDGAKVFRLGEPVTPGPHWQPR